MKGRFAAAVFVALILAGSAAGSAVIFLRAVPSPNNGALPNSLAGVASVSTQESWAVGGHGPVIGTIAPLIERNTGHGWQLVSAPAPAGGSSVLAAVSGSGPQDVWAVGWRRSPSANGRPLTEHWNGRSWTIVPSPDRGGSGFLTAVSALSATDAWAVGFFDDRNGFANALLEHWNGRAWAIVAAPGTSELTNRLTGVTVISPVDAWAVGYEQDPGSRIDDALIEHFDGSTWKLAATPSPANKLLSAVGGSSATDVWSVGAGFATAAAPARGLIEHWNGAKWTEVSSPGAAGFDLALTGVTARSPAEAWAVGWIHRSSGSPRTPVAERWSGTGWQLVPVTGLSGADSALFGATEMRDGQVWAVGSQASAAAVARTLVLANCPLCA